MLSPSKPVLSPPLLCEIQESGGHEDRLYPDAVDLVSPAPSMRPLRATEGTADKEKPQAQVAKLGGGSESREVKIRPRQTPPDPTQTFPSLGKPGSWRTRMFLKRF